MSAGEWTDSASSSVHVAGHKVGLMSAPGQAPEWWFYHADYRRVRLQTIGPEPRGPFTSRDLAKAALHQVDAAAVEDLVHQVGLPALDQLDPAVLEHLVAALKRPGAA